MKLALKFVPFFRVLQQNTNQDYDITFSQPTHTEATSIVQKGNRRSHSTFPGSSLSLFHWRLPSLLSLFNWKLSPLLSIFLYDNGQLGHLSLTGFNVDITRHYSKSVVVFLKTEKALPRFLFRIIIPGIWLFTTCHRDCLFLFHGPPSSFPQRWF